MYQSKIIAVPEGKVQCIMGRDATSIQKVHSFNTNYKRMSVSKANIMNLTNFTVQLCIEDLYGKQSMLIES